MLGLIIQGPLITYGQGPNNSQEGYDCFESIVSNVLFALENKINYVICVWEPNNEAEKNIFDRLKEKKYNIIKKHPPTIKDPDHRYKHHYSIKVGLDYLESIGVNYIIKIRTDMIFNHSILKSNYSKISNNKHVLLISELRYEAFYLGDFIFGGHIAILKQYLNSILPQNYGTDFLPSIAEDLGFKYFLYRNNLIYTVRSKYIFISYLFFLMFDYKTFSKKWKSFVIDNIITLDENEWNSIVWRGRKISEILNSNAFIFNIDKLDITEINFFHKFYYEMKKYYKKRFNS